MASPDDYEPGADSSYGLIYRLNFLWAKADREASSGKLDQWELTLDTIFRNLLYRELPEIEQDENGEVRHIEFSKEDVGSWKKIKENIVQAKKNKLLALKNRNLTNFNRSKKEHYDAVFFYDVWVRKFMHTMKLYMKEAASNPSHALFGSHFGARGGPRR